MTAPIRMKLGRKRNSGAPRVRLTANHVPPAYTPPATLDRYSAVPAATIGMDGNDNVGDCTCADVDHELKSVEVCAGNAEVHSTAAEVLAAYSAITGYNPADPSTDQGAEMQSVRSYWQKTGFRLGGTVHKILLFAEVKPSDLNAVKWTLDEFGAVGIGIDLPNAAMDQFNSGQPWDVVPDDGGIDGGHAVAIVGYDKDYVWLYTWGALIKATWAWWAKYVVEVWVAFTAEVVNAKSGSSATGQTLYQLGQQMASLTGKPNPVPPPIPSPTPAPTPVPVPVPVPSDIHVDGADEQLMTDLAPWLAEHHVGDNHKAVEHVRAWVAAKQTAKSAVA
jgi:hypothetical protein